MPTTKKRINVTLSDDMEAVLERLAKRDEVPVATKAIQLIKIAVEIDEDDILNEIAEERDTRKVKFVSHDKAWS